MQVSVFLLVLLFNSANSQRLPTKQDEQKNVKYGTKLRGVQCISNDNSTAQFTFCFVRSYSRTISTLNFGFKVNRDFKSSVFIRIVANYRYGTIYREIVDTKWINWCQLMDGADTNPFLKLILDNIRQSIPTLFHKCPYLGVNEFYNITIDDGVTKKITIFPEGQYKYVIMISNNEKGSILELVVMTEIKSPEKKSFG